MLSDILLTLKSLLPTKKNPTVPYFFSSPPKPPPKPTTTVSDTWWERFKHPSGVHPRHAIIVCYLGRIGFVAKGIVYAVMGGLCISTAKHMGADLDGVESPMGAFIFLGLSTIGTPLLVIMFIGLLFYSLWRFWEGGLGQGSDATRSAPSNFFRYRLSPIVSGAVYVAYLSYIGEVLSESQQERLSAANDSSNCFPACWGSGDIWHRMMVGVAGLAFIIAFITQVQNGFSNRWHRDLMIHHCTAVERYVILILGHLGFLSRAGVFMFVAVFMFRSLHTRMTTQKDTFSDAINQIIGVHGGQVGLWFLGIGLILFGIFAAANSYYKYYPTPPPSRYAFPSKQQIRAQRHQQDLSQNNNNDTTNSNINKAINSNGLAAIPSSCPTLLSPIHHHNNDLNIEDTISPRDSKYHHDISSTCPTSSTYPILPPSVHNNNRYRIADQQLVPFQSTCKSTSGIISRPASFCAPPPIGSSDQNDVSLIDNSPPSPFEETRRFRWQKKRLARTSNIA